MKKIRIFDALAYFSCVLFILASSLVSLNRYWQYEVFYYDFGIFDKAIWSVSRFKPPIIDHLAVGGKWIFADHFSPSIFLLSPLYWFIDRQEIILVAQALLVGLSGLVLYKIGLHILKNSFLSFSVIVNYFLFIGLQNAVITDFHEVTASTFPLMLAFWSILKGKKNLYFLLLIITLGFKESIFILFLGIGLYMYIVFPKWRKIAIFSTLISLVWGAISIRIVIPYFSDGIYQYSSLDNSGIGNVFYAFFNNPVKIKTLWFSFLSFGFLPLFFPPLWFAIVLDFFVRFIPNAPNRWDLGLHYSAQLSVILSISSIYSLALLGKTKQFSRYIYLLGFGLVLNSIVLHQFVLHGPLGLFYNKAFYSHTKNFHFLNEVIKNVPTTGSVMTHNNLAVRFTHQKVWLIRNSYGAYSPDFIVIDSRAGQNPNNFFGSGKILGILNLLKTDSDYIVKYKTDEQYVFEKVK